MFDNRHVEELALKGGWPYSLTLREGKFSATRLPVYGILGNRAADLRRPRKKHQAPALIERERVHFVRCETER
jgi:hypothetical protein